MSKQLIAALKTQIAELQIKADKWDALGEEIDACYVGEDGEELPDDGSIDLCTIGEIAANAYGWL